MQSNQIVVIEPPFSLGKANAKTYRQLADRALALCRVWEAHCNKQAQIHRDGPTASFDAASFADASQAIRHEQIDLLVRERALRLEILAFYDACEVDFAAERERSFEAHEMSKAQVHEKLLGIGYIDGLLLNSATQSITPGMLMQHPDVYRKLLDYQSLTNFSFSAHVSSNAAAISRIEEELARFRANL